MKPLFLSFFLVASVCSIAEAQSIISVNWYADGGGTEQLIDGTESFGVPGEGSVVENWNNVTWTQWGLLRSDATSSGVALDQLNATGGTGEFGVPLDNTPMKSGLQRWAANPAGYPQFQINYLNDEFTSGYKVIVYLTGAAWGTGTISDGSTTFSFKPSTEATLVETTDMGTLYPVANYAVFDGLSNDSVLFTTGGTGVSVAGFQVVSAIPEPSALALMGGLITLGALLFGRRRIG